MGENKGKIVRILATTEIFYTTRMSYMGFGTRVKCLRVTKLQVISSLRFREAGTTFGLLGKQPNIPTLPFKPKLVPSQQSTV